jgi:hypothetical protein
MELHAPLKIVQRSKGRTATGAAAYRAAERIECERTGQVHDYTRKQGVEGTALLSAQDAPAWTRNRAALWNAAEIREKHPRAQTAREVEVGFPHEFNAEQRREAGLGIAGLLVSRYGSATDIAWHQPGRKGDQRNYHAHILFTARPVTADGWAKTKRTSLDELRDGGADELKSLRGEIAGVLNDVACRHRLNVYVEHLSFEDRGLDREATQHLGPDATEMERRGEATDIGDKNRGIAARNAQRDLLLQEHHNVIDFALARQKRDRREPWTVFYREAQQRRSELGAALERQYGAQRAEASNELQHLQETQAKRHLVARLWHRVTGRERTENERRDALASTLRIIDQKKREAARAFEVERRQRLENLKRDMASAEREDQDRFTAFLQRQADDAEVDSRLADWEGDEGVESARGSGVDQPADGLDAFKDRMKTRQRQRGNDRDRSIS